LRRHALPDIFFGSHFDVKAQFLIDLAVNGLAISPSPQSVSQNFP
jgi:hypothetical protein